MYKILVIDNHDFILAVQNVRGLEIKQYSVRFTKIPNINNIYIYLIIINQLSINFINVQTD